ncbi:MAG: DUF3185 family protein [Halofilum sp. (in: g-proteobacteria)]|nr:DUF3185 family protein [Halofilum sp. (in: g-proteobacteria)]
MATSSKHIWRIAGIVLTVVGAAVIFWAWQDAQSLGNEITSMASGSPTDDVVYRYIGGGIALVIGVYALLARR